MDVGVRRLQDLLQPVPQFHVGFAAQLAEYRCPFDGLVGHAVQLAEQRRSTDLTHGLPPVGPTTASACKQRSSASVSARRCPSQVVHPSRRPAPSRVGGTSSFFNRRRTSQSSSKFVYKRTQSTSLRSRAPPGRKSSYCANVSGPRCTRNLCCRSHTRRPATAATPSTAPSRPRYVRSPTASGIQAPTNCSISTGTRKKCCRIPRRPSTLRVWRISVPTWKNFARSGTVSRRRKL